jgi:hypothetical protein
MTKRRNRQPRQHREGPYRHQFVRHANIIKSRQTRESSNSRLTTLAANDG